MKLGTPRKLLKQTRFCVSFIAPWWRNRSFRRTQSFRLLNRSFFQSSPVFMNLRWWLKEYCQKNKQQRYDICLEFSMWHFVTKTTGLKYLRPRMSSHISESRYPSYVSSAMCPDCPRKEWRTKSSFKLQSTPTGKRLKVRPRTRESDYMSDLAWSGHGVEPAELSQSAVDREVFPVRLGLLPPRLSPKEKRARKWINEWVCTPTYLNVAIYEIVFCLFTKNECRIQIIKQIWTETCISLKMS